jgi:hypothetical protein
MFRRSGANSVIAEESRMKVALVLGAMLALLLTSARAANPLLGPLNDAANALFSAAGAANRQTTAVVPIVTSAGLQNGYAQIEGAPSNVRRVRAVVEVRSPSGGGWSITALVPVSTVSARSAAIHRVYGVATDALVNYGG